MTPDATSPLAWGQVRRAALEHRRVLSAALAGLAVALLVSAAVPGRPTSRVMTAAHDLLAGQLLSSADLIVRAVPRALVPTGAVSAVEDLSDRQVAGPVRAGEVLTDVRLVGRPLLDALRNNPGMVAVTVTLADAAAASVLAPGDRVDVLASTGSARPVELAHDGLVLALTTSGGNRPGRADSLSGPHGPPDALVLAVAPPAAAKIAAAAESRLTVVLHGEGS